MFANVTPARGQASDGRLDQRKVCAEPCDDQRDPRNVFADTVLSSLLVGAADGNREHVAQLVDELVDAVREFMCFVNAAINHWLIGRRDHITTTQLP